MTFRFKIAVLVYVALVIGLALAGLWGDRDPASLENALRHFNAGEIALGRSYFTWGMVPSLLARIASIAVVIFFIIRHDSITLVLSRRAINPALRMFAHVALLLIALFLARFPFALVAGFWRNKIFGLLTADFPLWLYRYLLSEAIELVLAAAVFTLFLFIAGRARHYRFYLPALFLVLSLAVVYLHPRIIVPLFYTLSPMPAGGLRSDIDALLARTDMRVRDIYIINESRYTTRGNAYFTGYGAFREIHLYDTVISGHGRGEVLAIIAHELCHYREEHVLIGLILGSGGLFLGLALIDGLCRFLLGMSLADAARLGLVGHIILIFSMTMFVSRPVENGISRVMERRCDAYSLVLTGNPAAAVSMTKKLALSNRSDVLPNGIFRWFNASHPSTLERIRASEVLRAVE